eukprot:TRINITY_DN14194_c0_g2_i2.p1 TRINITY_DN14194_c0_g2~~TRINITY_DN14194_c0_g2_i2.p1  ORF type:complete len:291 (-),score=24.62 TRINITY_DN14194_c0_g2_i2:236-1072(-)
MVAADFARQCPEASVTDAANVAEVGEPLPRGDQTLPLVGGDATVDKDVFYAMSRCSPEWQHPEARVTDAAELGLRLPRGDSTFPLRHGERQYPEARVAGAAELGRPFLGCDSTLPLCHGGGTTSESDAFHAMSRCSPECLPLPAFLSREPKDAGVRDAEVATPERPSGRWIVDATLKSGSLVGSTRPLVVAKFSRCSHGQPAGVAHTASIGSALHASGQCLPCKYIKQNAGCKDGVACTFCHCAHAELSQGQTQKRFKKHVRAYEATFHSRFDFVLSV